MALTVLTATKKAAEGTAYLLDGTKAQADLLVAAYPDNIAIQEYVEFVNGVAGYQEIVLDDTDIEWGDDSGLAKYTSYTFKVAVDGGAAAQYTITLSSDTSYGAVIQAVNSVISSCSLSIEAGVLRVTSATKNATSDITLSTPTATNKLFEAMTGFDSYDTAVVGEDGDPESLVVLNILLPTGGQTAFADDYIYISTDINDVETIEFVMPKDQFEFLYTVVEA